MVNELVELTINSYKGMLHGFFGEGSTHISLF